MASSSSDVEDSEVHYAPYRITRSQSRQIASQTTSQSASQSTSQSTSNIDTLLPSQSVREKRLYLSSVVINSARERLLTFQKDQEEGYTGSNEIIIKENVSLNEYLCYLKNNEITSVRMYLHNGNIKVYEVPVSYPHGVAAGRIMILMGKWNDQDFEYGTDSTTILGQNTSRAPDHWVRPIQRPRPQQGAPAADDIGNAYPTMMVEVGYAQSLPDLDQTAANYFDPQTTIQIVLTIKIFRVHTDNTIALTASLYLRTSPTPLIPTRVISFGTADIDTSVVNHINNVMGVLPSNLIGVGLTDSNNNNNNYPPCNAANIPTYLLNIPGPELYNGVPANLCPAGFAAGFDLDLWEVQVSIRRQFNI